jgi:hypothetical protein
MEIIQIVPALPPVVNGLGDHALLLARELRDRHDVNTTFIVGDPSARRAKDVDGFSIQILPGRSAPQFIDLFEALSSKAAIVLLHYVGYGYARRGCPFWLVDALEKWRHASDDRTLITMFHELYASGPFWRSSFWTSRCQKGLTKRLADVSDHCRTSIKVYADILAELSPRHRNQIPFTPVFSNVGELSEFFPEMNRKPKLLVFGNANSRRAIYERRLEELTGACLRLNLSEIVDVGPRTGMNPTFPIPYHTMGILEIDALGKVFREVSTGIVNYPSAYLGKSTIFAAYAAHGVVPLLLNAGERPCEDGLHNGNQYLETAQLIAEAQTRNLSEIAGNVFNWYSSHTLKRQAASLASCISRLRKSSSVPINRKHA